MRILLASLLVLAAVRPALGQDDPARVWERTPDALPRAAPGRWRDVYATDPPCKDLAPELVATLDRAAEFLRAGDHPAALVLLYPLLEREPDLPPALLLLGTACFKVRRYGDAITAYERFLEGSPSEVWRTQALAHARYSLGEYESACAHYRRVLAFVPESVEALFGLALATLKLGEEREALAHLRRVTELRPEHEEAWAWIAQILDDQGRAEDALPFAERALERAPFDPRGWFLLTGILRELGRTEEAAAAEERWRRLDAIVQEVRAVEARLLLTPHEAADWHALVELWRAAGNAAGARAALAGFQAAGGDADPFARHAYALEVLLELGDSAGATRAARALEACCGERRDAAALLERYRSTRLGG